MGRTRFIRKHNKLRDSIFFSDHHVLCHSRHDPCHFVYSAYAVIGCCSSCNDWIKKIECADIFDKNGISAPLCALLAGSLSHGPNQTERCELLLQRSRLYLILSRICAASGLARFDSPQTQNMNLAHPTPTQAMMPRAGRAIRCDPPVFLSPLGFGVVPSIQL